MQALQKFITVMLLFGIGLLLSIIVMMYGWGLEPQSWWWIIGGGIGLRLIVEAMTSISKAKVKE